MSYISLSVDDNENRDLLIEFLRRNSGKELSVTFIDSKGQTPEPINVKLECIEDVVTKRAIFSIPLDKIYCVDEELY